MYWAYLIGMIIVCIAAGLGSKNVWERVEDEIISTLGAGVLAIVSIVAGILALTAATNTYETDERTVVVTSVISTTTDRLQIVDIKGVRLNRAQDSVRCDTPENVSWCASLKIGDSITVITQHDEFGFGRTYPIVPEAS